jgi:hypothetical protein
LTIGLNVTQSDSEEIWFNEVPAPLAALMKDLVSKVDEKYCDLDEYESTEYMRSFINGEIECRPSELSSEMARLLRYLT